jgi:hypothetical protein
MIEIGLLEFEIFLLKIVHLFYKVNLQICCLSFNSFSTDFFMHFNDVISI